MSRAVKIGTTFRSTFADSRPEWKVVGSRGKGVWDCEVVSEDWNGRKKVFSTEEINGERGMDDVFENLNSEHDQFWNSRKVGEVLHYHNGFGQYVRGVVVMKDGKTALCPTALVGNWKVHDLPRRLENGETRSTHHAERIAEKDAWQPSHTNTFESPAFGRQTEDPRDMPEIDITIPPATPEQEELLRLAAIRARAREVLTDWKLEPLDALRQAQAILEAETF